MRISEKKEVYQKWKQSLTTQNYCSRRDHCVKWDMPQNKSQGWQNNPDVLYSRFNRERERERLRKGQRKLKGWNTWYVPLILSSLNSTWKEKLSHKRKNNLGCLRDKLLSTLVWVLFFYFFQITWPSRIHLSCWNMVSVRVIGDCLLGLENWKWSNKPPVPKAVDKRTETSVNISSQRMPEN